MAMISEILLTLFFAIDKIFGQFFWVLSAFLIVIGIIFSLIFQMTKR
jgi:uncharacterized membrane protein